MPSFLSKFGKEIEKIAGEVIDDTPKAEDIVNAVGNIVKGAVPDGAKNDVEKVLDFVAAVEDRLNIVEQKLKVLLREPQDAPVESDK